MTDLHSALQRYLNMRKGFGFKYQHQTRRLADFISFMDKCKATTITTKLAMEWATLPAGRHASWALRLTDVRGFARHIASFDPKTEVPPVGLLPSLKRAKPYVYSDEEVSALLAAALSLPPAGALRRWTDLVPGKRTPRGLLFLTLWRLYEEVRAGSEVHGRVSASRSQAGGRRRSSRQAGCPFSRNVGGHARQLGSEGK
jgi:hypothetical protein